ncbi:helix-turn-helix domain-containing protein [Clostridium tyrobutyricum]|uniref:helix-turn-helix domain-containing protein n=1 Tax=Clostridium tyrobutyricum TaxID=1519 RepID=UPI001C393C33|nr:helix-turn-helix transcriptional regulator [Clostridium tyrobutyricum]MBV4439562.1 helix-turn-helix transcriptional regulator [Clostridium tyrobutyricum]
MKIYWYDGNKNIVGLRVKQAGLSHNPPLTQDNLSAKLELMNIKLDRISISRIESGNRFVADYEIVGISRALNISLNWLLLGEN